MTFNWWLLVIVPLGLAVFAGIVSEVRFQCDQVRQALEQSRRNSVLAKDKL